MATKKQSSKSEGTGKGGRARLHEIEQLARAQERDGATAVVRRQESPPRQRGRHDLGEPPKNHTFRNGVLVPTKGPDFGPPDQRAMIVAQNLLVNLGHLFQVDGRSLGSIVKRLLSAATPLGEPINRRVPNLEKAYEAFNGHKFGDREWWEEILAGQIEMAARRAYEHAYQKLQIDRHAKGKGEHALSTKASADLDWLKRCPGCQRITPLGTRRCVCGYQWEKPPQGAFEGAADGKAVFEYLCWSSNGTRLPPELTADRIQAMIDRCAVGGNRAGGGRKPAALLVKEFKDQLPRN